MRLDYSDNALNDMRVRGIQPKEIIFTLEHPDSTRVNKKGTLEIYEEHPEGRLIIVAVSTYDPALVTSASDFRWTG